MMERRRRRKNMLIVIFFPQSAKEVLQIFMGAFVTLNHCLFVQWYVRIKICERKFFLEHKNCVVNNHMYFLK